MQKMAEENETDDDGQETNLSLCTIGDCKLNKIKLRDMILLDNQSTTDIFCNKKPVKNIRRVEEVMTVVGKGGELAST
jgi:hypothetical protein